MKSKNLIEFWKKDKEFILLSLFFILILLIVDKNINNEVNKIEDQYKSYIENYCTCSLEKKKIINISNIEIGDLNGNENKNLNP